MKCTTCTSPIHPVVALDIDGTLGDYHLHFIQFLENYLGIVEESWWDYDGSTELSDWLGLDKRTYQDAKLAYRAGGYKRWMPPFAGVAYLLEAAATFKVEVWITTTRPWMRMDNIDPDTREWLRRNGVDFTGLLFDEGKYERLIETVDAARIVMVLEDQLDQCQAADALNLPVVMRRTKWNQSFSSQWHGPVAPNLFDASDRMVSQVKEWYRHEG